MCIVTTVLFPDSASFADQSYTVLKPAFTIAFPQAVKTTDCPAASIDYTVTINGASVLPAFISWSANTLQLSLQSQSD
jgi:hypothetical protein